MFFLISLIFALAITGGLVITKGYHGVLSYDNDLEGVQKFHSIPTPRIGGLAILLSFMLGLIIIKLYDHNYILLSKEWVIPVLIVFTAGLIEDFTKNIPPWLRMLLFILATVVAVFVTHSLAIIHYTDFSILDATISSYPVIGFLLTLFCVIGIINAYNIIDGYHGLAAISLIFNLLGIAVFAVMIGDFNSFRLISGVLGALLGFLIYNYPKGKIFLGDGGAYMLGFIIAVTSINTMEQHPGLISPYALLLMAIYPITEVGFSIYRKKFLRHTPAMQPDGLHMHMLIYKRCTQFQAIYRNSHVIIIMLSLIVPQVVLAIIFRTNTYYCIGLTIAYIVFYVWLYFSIVKFRAPWFLKYMLDLNFETELKGSPEAKR